MSEYSVTVLVDASRSFTVQAESPDQAAEIADELYYEESGGLCHQCARELDVGDVTAAVVYEDEKEVLNTGYMARRVADLEAERDTLRAELAALKAPAPAQDERKTFEVEIPDISAIYDGRSFIPYRSLEAGERLMTVAQHLRIEKQLRAALTRPAQTEQQPVAWIVPDFGFLFPTQEAASRYLKNIEDPREPRAVYAAPIAQTPADGLVEALEHARHFIRNGVALGYIKMPDAGTPDPAHDTLPKIEAALAAHRAGGAA